MNLWKSPAAALVSTAGDFQRFMSMLQHGGALDGTTFLSPRSVAMMTRNHLPHNATIGDIGRGVFKR